MRRYGGLDSCEDAVQEALLDAAMQWPASGAPDNPRAWLLTVATRRLTDILRSESARRRREDADLPGDAACRARWRRRVAPDTGLPDTGRARRGTTTTRSPCCSSAAIRR